MKSFIALLAFVALTGQALSIRVRREVDESDPGKPIAFGIKTDKLNFVLEMVLTDILAKDSLGADISKDITKACGLCTAIKALGGDINEDNKSLLTTVSDLFTEEQQQKCGVV